MYQVDKVDNTLYQNKVSKEYAVKLGKIGSDEKISILSDVMFKTMFQTKGREQYPSKFISYYTNYSFEDLMKNLVFDKNELDKNVVNKKGLRCDYVSSIDGIKLNIEINNNSSFKTMERNMEYAFRLYASSVSKDSDYDYTKVIQFNINNFAFENNHKIIDIFTIKNDDSLNLTDKIIFVQIYIPNLRKKWYTSGICSLNEDEKFLLTLVETNIESSRELGKDNGIMEEYINEAVDASKSEELLEAYDKEWALKDEGKREGFQEGYEDGYVEGKQEGYEVGKQQGFEDGKQQGFEDGKQQGFDEGNKRGYDEGCQTNQAKIVRNMLTEKIETSLISKITGLSETEINEIKNEMQ